MARWLKNKINPQSPYKTCKALLKVCSKVNFKVINEVLISKHLFFDAIDTVKCFLAIIISKNPCEAP